MNNLRNSPILDEIKQKIQNEVNPKLYLFKNEKLKFENFNNLIHDPKIDLTIYTALYFNYSYIYIWYHSMCRFLENTDILNVKKIVLLTTDNCKNVLSEIVSLFNLPTLFEIRICEGFCTKYTFLLNENIETNFVIQDADLYPYNIPNLYENISNYLNNSNNSNNIIMVDERCPFLIKPEETILYRFIGDKKLSNIDLFENRTDIKIFFEKLNIDFDNYSKYIKHWYNSSIVGLNKNSKIVTDYEIINEFVKIENWCDETLWLSSCIRNNIKPILLFDIMGIPFSFFYNDLRNFNSFILSLNYDINEYEININNYNKILFNIHE
jgi:hypothetical protein